MTVLIESVDPWTPTLCSRSSPCPCWYQIR